MLFAIGSNMDVQVRCRNRQAVHPEPRWLFLIVLLALIMVGQGGATRMLTCSGHVFASDNPAYHAVGHQMPLLSEAHDDPMPGMGEPTTVACCFCAMCSTGHGMAITGVILAPILVMFKIAPHWPDEFFDSVIPEVLGRPPASA